MRLTLLLPALALAVGLPSTVPPLLQSQRSRSSMLQLMVGKLPAWPAKKMMESNRLRCCELRREGESTMESASH